MNDALPVRLATLGPQAHAIRTWVEGVAGWQPVADATAVLVPPLVTLADVAGAPGADRSPLVGADRSGTPVVLLVTADDDAASAARAAVQSGARAVLSWPSDRDRLLEVVGAEFRRDPDVAPVAEIRVGGAAGGVGTTTVALAVAGLTAWRTRRAALVLSHGAVPSPTGPALAPEDVAGRGTWDAARPARGVPGLRVLRLTRPARSDPVDPGVAEVLVRDHGVDDDVDLLVLRRDAAGLAALETTTAPAAVVVDQGAAPPAALRAAAGGRRLVIVAWSARVARAGLAGRVPAGLPGTWLRALAGFSTARRHPALPRHDRAG